MRSWLVRFVLASSLLVPVAVLAKDVRIEKHFPLAAGGTLALRSSGGSVTVQGGAGTEAVVLVTSNRPDFEKDYLVRFDSKPNRLEVVVERKSKGFLSWFSSSQGSVKVEVAVPRAANAEVSSSGGGVQVSGLQGTVKADSSGGGVRLADIGGSVTLSSSGGSVVAERVRGPVRAESSGGGVEVRSIEGTVHLESSGGSVVAENVKGDLEASTSGGGVRIAEAHGKVTAESSGGPVKVSFAAGNSRGGSLDSSGGGVAVQVDPSVGLQIDAISSGGRVSSDLPVKAEGAVSKTSLRGTLNGGGAVLKLRSSGGGVSLAPR